MAAGRHTDGLLSQLGSGSIIESTMDAPSNRSAQRIQTGWRWTVSRIALLTTALVCHALWAADPALAPFTVGVASAPDTYAFKFLTRVYTEAFARLKVPVRFVVFPLKRQELEMEAGRIDAEANRAMDYGASRPDLLRVDEPVLELNLALFTAHPGLRLDRIEDLSTNGMQVEYRRGIVLCEKALKPLVPPERLSDVATHVQGLKKLLALRTDVYCDFSLNIAIAQHTPEFANATGIRKLMDVAKVVATYPYLHERHSETARRLAAVLKAMKAEGLFETYHRQVEREQGWVR